MEACREVNADKFISKLSRGLDEEVRERGNNFSAGQRQLLSFARTIVQRPEVMILDEATSALDTVTETRIQKAFDKLAEGRTTVIIAHRLSTIRGADRIVLIDDGEIKEDGSHQELMTKGGQYAQLYRYSAI